MAPTRPTSIWLEIAESGLRHIIFRSQSLVLILRGYPNIVSTGTMPASTFRRAKSMPQAISRRAAVPQMSLPNLHWPTATLHSQHRLTSLPNSEQCALLLSSRTLLLFSHLPLSPHTHSKMTIRRRISPACLTSLPPMIQPRATSITYHKVRPNRPVSTVPTLTPYTWASTIQTWLPDAAATALESAARSLTITDLSYWISLTCLEVSAEHGRLSGS